MKLFSLSVFICILISTVPPYLVAIGPEPFKTWATNPCREGPVVDF